MRFQAEALDPVMAHFMERAQDYAEDVFGKVWNLRRVAVTISGDVITIWYRCANGLNERYEPEFRHESSCAVLLEFLKKVSPTDYFATLKSVIDDFFMKEFPNTASTSDHAA